MLRLRRKRLGARQVEEINILPLPMLDGGRMTFVLIEVLRRGRRIAPAKEALVHLVGMAALLILVIVLSYFDLARIIRGESIFR
jgi:regulator of sigma E protease